MASQTANITTREVARIAGVHASTVRKWVADGVLPWATKTPGGHYRFNRDIVLATLKASPEQVSA
jgi:excisionase family DNA binding protein